MKMVGNLLKMLSNFDKHGIPFEEAEECIWSTVAHVEEDTKHSTDLETRFHLISKSPNNRIIFVVFCKRNNGLETRIISARKASKKERKKYFEIFGEDVEFKTIKKGIPIKKIGLQGYDNE